MSRFVVQPGEYLDPDDPILKLPYTKAELLERLGLTDADEITQRAAIQGWLDENPAYGMLNVEVLSEGYTTLAMRAHAAAKIAEMAKTAKTAKTS
jgi:hypothetical protein